MDPRLELVLVGISHRTAPLAVRERYVVGATDLEAMLGSLRGLRDVEECFVLSTCNRTEVLVAGPKGSDLALRVRAHAFRNAADEHVYEFRDVQALIHVFRIAAGLESLILGESEVLGQLKRGIDAARAAGTLGPLLDPLLRQALHAGKRVRTETELARGTLSVARVGLDIATRVFGGFRRRAALVIGAGETGVLVARHLRDLDVGKLDFAARSPEKALVEAGALGAGTHALERIPDLLLGVDLVVACVEAEQPTVRAAHFDARALARRDGPLVLLDLSVPRAIAPDVAELDANVLLHDLDDLQRSVGDNARQRAEAARGSSEIVVAEMHRYLTMRTYSAFSPAIAGLQQRFAQIRDEALDAVSGARSDPRDVELAHELTKRLLDAALDQMKAGARSVRDEAALDREYQRFLEGL